MNKVQRFFNPDEPVPQEETGVMAEVIFFSSSSWIIFHRFIL